MELKVNLGLCNRLRALFSFYEQCKETKETLYVDWTEDDICPGIFTDYFEPLENVVFQKNNKKPSNGRWSREFNPFDGKNIYKDLKPKIEILDEINDLKKILKKNYLSIHVRRTDHVLFRKGKKIHVEDDYFFKFLDKSEKRIYIATDNFETQEMYYNKYKERIKYIKFITSNKFRRTSLRDAIIDIYMCINSERFLGTPWSSFSSLIKHNRY